MIKSYRVPKKDFENILKIYCDFYFGASQFFPSYYDGKMNPVNYTEEVKNNYSKMSPIHIGHPVVCIINIRADDKLPQFFILHECVTYVMSSFFLFLFRHRDLPEPTHVFLQRLLREHEP